MRENNLIVSVAIVLAALGAGYYFLRESKTSDVTTIPPRNEGMMCTMEAMLCPDGSYVGRSGPKCEFALCPSEAVCEGGVCPNPAATSSTSTKGEGSGILSYNSGIRGTISLGPTCPVQRDPPDAQCADRPYETEVSVFRANDAVRVIATVKSDSTGAFSVSLQPGEYTLGAGEEMFPHCDSPSVTVPSKGYAAATISCDTGIR
ncbi:MAG: hypothetical protein Q7R93_05465 [bacterium]|nr:hypothetical protein [bacterium]